MKLFKAFLIVFLLTALTSCGKFSDGTSIWQKGMWVLPWVTGIMAGVFGVAFYKTWSSGWRRQVPGSGEMQYGKERLPFYTNGYFWFSAVFFIATVLIIILWNNDK